MNRIAYVSVVVFMLLQGIAFSQDEPPKVKTKTPEQIQAVLKKEAEKLTERYQQKISQVDLIYDQQLKVIKDKAVKELGKLQKEVASKDLDEAIRIREMAKSIDAESALVVDQSANEMHNLKAKLKTLEQANKNLSKEMEKAPEIPSIAVKYNGHSYVVVDDPAVYRIAANNAKLAGGYLARIDTDGELEWINKLISRGKLPFYYIDGLDDVQNGQWLFADGSPTLNIAWDTKAKQPDNRLAECVLCVKRTNGRIHDHHTADNFGCGCIIEWDE